MLNPSSATVTWLPTQSRKEIPALLRASDLFALPSVGEGLPLCALEAMASALPILLTDDPGYRKVLGDRAVTYVSPDSHSIRQAICEMLSNPERMEEQGKLGRELALKSFSWDENVRRHIELYEHLIQQNR
jgi:glycosyltransferase involved in cell wall biosynthesis